MEEEEEVAVEAVIMMRRIPTQKQRPKQLKDHSLAIKRASLTMTLHVRKSLSQNLKVPFPATRLPITANFSVAVSSSNERSAPALLPPFPPQARLLQ